MALQLTLVILWSSSPTIQTQSSVPAAALSLVNAVATSLLSFVEDRKSERPSSLLSIYLLFSTVFDATQVRTLWITDRTDVAGVQSASIGVKILMLCLEAQAKTSYLKQPYRGYPPEATSGILNLSFVWWLNKLFVVGFRKLITSQELFDIDQALRSKVLAKRLQVAWNRRSKEQTSLPDASQQLITALRNTRRTSYSSKGSRILLPVGFVSCSVSSTLHDRLHLCTTVPNNICYQKRGEIRVYQVEN